MNWAMRRVLLGGGLLSAGGRAGGLVALLFVLGCDLSGGIESTDPQSSEESSTVGLRVPACDDATCEDDGCGGQCACQSGFECDSSKTCVETETCTPDCDSTRCDDGCGGTCECAPGRVCNAERDCVLPVDCIDDCEEAHYVCGLLCGVDCGVCGEEETCSFGKCKSHWSSLTLRLIEVSQSAGRSKARLAIEFEPREGQILPRMADLRLALEGGNDLQLEAVSLGDSLESAGKSLFTDALTGKPWQVLPDGAVQLLVYSSQNVSEVGAGQWLTIEVSFRSSGDAQLHLVRKEGLFAPLSADSAIQGSAYDLPITVTP